MGLTNSHPIGDGNIVLPISYRGVQLKVAKDVLNELEEKHVTVARRKLSREPSHGEVIVHGYIKDKCAGQSLAQLLAQYPASNTLVGKCNVFLSHTWGSPFAETVAALEEYESQLPKGSPICYYFIDYFAINQFDPSKDLKELGQLAKNCSTLLLLTSPWDKPVVLERAWCIFEVAHAVLGNSEIVLAMPPKEKKNFHIALSERLKDYTDAVSYLEIFSNIETRKMKASDPRDLKGIRNFMIDTLGGFEKVDHSVSESLRRCFGKVAFDFGESYIPSGTAEHVKVLRTVSQLLTRIRMHDHDLKNAQKRRVLCSKLSLQSELIHAINDEAIALKNLGRYAESISSAQKLLEIFRTSANPQAVLDVQFNLADIYFSARKWDEAKDLLTTCLEGYKNS